VPAKRCVCSVADVISGPNQLKFDGSYRTPWKLLVSASFRAQSGIPFNALIPHPIYGNNEGFAVRRGMAINPVTGRNRTPTTYNLDLGAYYPIKLGESRQLRIQVDWFNVFNSQRAVRQDEYDCRMNNAGSAWVDDYEKYEWQRIHPLLDFINVMTYWGASGKTRPISPLYKSSNETGRWSDTFNTDYAVTRYLKEGVPANQIVISVPFFGRGWEGVPDANNGLFQKPSKVARGSWGEGEESYGNLRSLKGFRLFRISEMLALWIFNPKAGVFW
jgi:hypothetical protein